MGRFASPWNDTENPSAPWEDVEGISSPWVDDKVSRDPDPFEKDSSAPCADVKSSKTPCVDVECARSPWAEVGRVELPLGVVIVLGSLLAEVECVKPSFSLGEGLAPCCAEEPCLNFTWGVCMGPAPLEDETLTS